MLYFFSVCICWESSLSHLCVCVPSLFLCLSVWLELGGAMAYWRQLPLQHTWPSSLITTSIRSLCSSPVLARSSVTVCTPSGSSSCLQSPTPVSNSSLQSSSPSSCFTFFAIFVNKYLLNLFLSVCPEGHSVRWLQHLVLVLSCSMAGLVHFNLVF